MDLNERLKNARKKAGLTQAQIAVKLNISEGTVKRYEKDSSRIPVGIVSNIALLCDVDEMWLFTGGNTQDRIDTNSSVENKKSILQPSNIFREYQNAFSQFKDHEKAKEFIELLIYIENEDPEGYSELLKEAKTISKTIRRLKVKPKKTS